MGANEAAATAESEKLVMSVDDSLIQVIRQAARQGSNSESVALVLVK